jgi:hypothetical protein
MVATMTAMYSSTGAGHPVAAQLLRRARAELDAADTSADAQMRFLHAHMAAIRSASAVLALGEGPAPRRRRVLSVWEQLAAVGPEWESWAALFAAGAPIRAAIEAGRSEDLEPGVAEAAVLAAEAFVGEVCAAAESATARAGRLRVAAPIAS